MNSSLLWNTTITFHPELAAAALKDKSWDCYAIYCILKDVDRITEGRGVLKLAPVLGIIKDLYGLKSNHAYAIFEKGIGKYWRSPNGKYGQKRFGLISFKQIGYDLKPTMPRCLPFRIRYNELLPLLEMPCASYMKSNLLSMVASRLGRDRPQSILSIQEHTGLSRATVYNLLNKNDLIEKHHNYVIAHTDMSYDEVMQMQREFVRSKIGKFRTIRQDDGQYMLLSQIPNSYSMPISRGNFKNRPEALKYNAWDDCAASKYGSTGSIKPLIKIDSDDLGAIKLWTSDHVQIPEIKPLIIQHRSLTS